MTWKTTREFTNRLLVAVDEGVIDAHLALVACLNYMSEADVEDMCHINDFFPEDIENEEL